MAANTNPELDYAADVPRPKMGRFEVRRGEALIDVVFYTPDMSAKDVRRSLIDHDGLPSDISVYRCAVDGRHAYDDVARVSHPEEL